ncbi:hypothetical protein CP8484711_1772B, partial [Chlamydia psittaci 84-8471/1]
STIPKLSFSCRIYSIPL